MPELVIPPLSHSEFKTWKTCRRKWALSYYWQFAPAPENEKPASIRDLGTRVHFALEAWYGYGLDPMKVLDWEYTGASIANPGWEDELAKERSMAETMVSGYLEWIADEGIDLDYEVIGTEHDERALLELPGGKLVQMRGHLDQLIRRRSDGAILFRDFKTVGAFSKANILAIDTQMRFYTLLQSLAVDQQKEGERADGGLYTMLLRSKRTVRATPPFYQEVEVRFNGDDRKSMATQVHVVAMEMAAARQRLAAHEDHHAVVYSNPSDACGWHCPFVNICPMMDDGSRWQDALRANFIQADPYAYYSHGKIEAVRAALSTG